jgi:hypothetical protein
MPFKFLKLRLGRMLEIAQMSFEVLATMPGTTCSAWSDEIGTLPIFSWSKSNVWPWEERSANYHLAMFSIDHVLAPDRQKPHA